jgi:hypothetical protein
MGWFEVGPEDTKTVVNREIQRLLDSSASYVAIDNTSITKAQRVAWMDYRQKLKELHLQIGFPNEVFWPARPE